MNKFIVITTINYPTEATLKYIAKKDWKVIVVGDKKTPHGEYAKLDCIYLTPEYQEKTYEKVSKAIGWWSIQRRNIGFIEAYNRGADILATVDDDNIPYDNWGENIYLDKEIECDYYGSKLPVIDPLQATNHKELWHRGYPIELVKDRGNIEYLGKRKITPLIQANLWDGDPDIDAIERLTMAPIVKFNCVKPFCFNKISPFNSQNTLLSRKVIPYYAMLTNVGRMDDIWASYILQNVFRDSLIYAGATVYQDRNKQDLIRNLENECLGYRNTLKFIENPRLDELDFISNETKFAYEEYRRAFE